MCVTCLVDFRLISRPLRAALFEEKKFAKKDKSGKKKEEDEWVGREESEREKEREKEKKEKKIERKTFVKDRVGGLSGSFSFCIES